jgi:hypothetical protein
MSHSHSKSGNSAHCHITTKHIGDDQLEMRILETNEENWTELLNYIESRDLYNNYKSLAISCNMHSKQLKKSAALLVLAPVLKGTVTMKFRLS